MCEYVTHTQSCERTGACRDNVRGVNYACLRCSASWAGGGALTQQVWGARNHTSWQGLALASIPNGWSSYLYCTCASPLVLLSGVRNSVTTMSWLGAWADQLEMLSFLGRIPGLKITRVGGVMARWQL